MQPSAELPTDHFARRSRDQSPNFDSDRLRHRIKFDDLARLDQSLLSATLHKVDAEVLVLALAGANEELIDRIATQMPRATAKAFRNRLRHLGPTRLRDVETAQQEVADVAAKIIHNRRRATALVG
jgi:flagellar motor switch protein FliG